MVMFGVDFVNVESTRAEKDWSFWNSISVIESWHKTSEKKNKELQKIPFLKFICYEFAYLIIVNISTIKLLLFCP